MTGAGAPDSGAGGAEAPLLPRLPQRLCLLPLAPESPPTSLLKRLANTLSRSIGAPVVLAPELAADRQWLSAEQSQLLSTRIVDALIERYPTHDGAPPPEWLLAVTAADLCAAGRSFVFGEAAVGGSWAVVSTARLGVPGPLLEERLLKEALHELGHLAGLGHCVDPACVMFPSADVAAVDAKSTEFCALCRYSPVHG